MKIEPLADRVLVEMDAPEKMSRGGIVLPDGSQDEAKLGHVRAIGSAVDSLQVGDKVFCGKYSGQEWEIDDRQFKVIKAADIYCRITE